MPLAWGSWSLSGWVRLRWRWRGNLPLPFSFVSGPSQAKSQVHEVLAFLYVFELFEVCCGRVLQKHTIFLVISLSVRRGSTF